MSLGISNPALGAVIEGNSDPIRDRMLAYMSQKTKRDIIYAFQRKVLGEELKEIINAILEYDLKRLMSSVEELQKCMSRSYYL